MNKEISYTLKHPFIADIKKVSPLNKKGSSKSNHHVEISLEGSNISYEVGCSFGLLPHNHIEDVNRLISILGTTTELIVEPKKLDKRISIYDFLLNHVNLHRVTKKIATILLPFQEDNDLHTIIETNWKEYTANHDLVEFLETYYRHDLDINILLNTLSPMLPRFYSVASSQKIVENNIHLLVADFTYTKGTKTHKSITTQHLLTKDSIRLFHQPNPSFHPPKEDTPIIMIGPGTGLAAFRGFLQERILFNKSKNNTLFTGDRNRAFDFYYEEELVKYQSDGFLNLFCAFSRDSNKKVYVQDRMWEHKEILFDQITKQNAHIYVSGDADKMAKDVTAMLEKIYSDQSKSSPEEGHSYIRAMKKEKRLHMDVY